MRRFLIFAASLAFLPAMALAQGRGGGHAGGSMGGHFGGSMSGGARPAMAAPSAASHSFAPSAPRFYAANRAPAGTRLVRTRSGALAYVRTSPYGTSTALGPRSSRRILSEDVPGLGFDYTHLANVHPYGNPGRNWGRNGRYGAAYYYFPYFYGGGYYLPFYDDEDDTGDVDEAPPVEEQPADTYAEAEEPPPPDMYDRPQAEPSSRDYVPERPAPAKESDEYVFVRRDGTLFFAVAYTWDKSTLRYITSEGVRRTVAGSTLDLNATRQFNEDRGLNFTLPA